MKICPLKSLQIVDKQNWIINVQLIYIGAFGANILLANLHNHIFWQTVYFISPLFTPSPLQQSGSKVQSTNFPYYVERHPNLLFAVAKLWTRQLQFYNIFTENLFSGESKQFMRLLITLQSK